MSRASVLATAFVVQTIEAAIFALVLWIRSSPDPFNFLLLPLLAGLFGVSIGLVTCVGIGLAGGPIEAFPRLAVASAASVLPAQALLLALLESATWALSRVGVHTEDAVG